MLLQRHVLETLSEAKDLDDLAARLKGTPYNESVSKLEKLQNSETLEMAFREHLASTHYAIMRVSPRYHFLTAYYGKYLIWNLKTIAKGKAIGLSHDEIASKINFFAEEQVGRRDIIVRSLNSPDLESIPKALLKTEFSKDLAEAIKIYRTNSDLLIFDTYLDRAFYKNLINEYNRLTKKIFPLAKHDLPDKANVRPIISIDLDSYNIISLLRAKVWDLSAPQSRELIIAPIFDVPLKKLERIISSGNLTEALKKVSETSYKRLVSPEVSNEESINKLESEFKLLVYKRALKSFTWQGSGLGVDLGIIRLKELEVQNLSALAFGVEQSLGSSKIISKMTLI